jgi:hypothetical protein
MGGQQQRCGATRHCRRLRRTTAKESRVVDESLRMVDIGDAAGRPQAADVRAGRSEIGIARPVAAARPIRHGEPVVGRFDTADGDQVRVARR